MQDYEITAVVKQTIEQAAKKQGLSLAKLTKQLGKGATTIHRWRWGHTVRFEMPTLIEIFKLADSSMDVAFGLVGDSTDIQLREKLAASEQQRDALHYQVATLQSLVQAMTSVLQNVEQTLQPIQALHPQDSGEQRIDHTVDLLKDLEAQRAAEDRDQIATPESKPA